MISGHSEDLIAADSVSVCGNPRLASHTKITQEVQNVIGFHGRIQSFENRLIHLSDSREGPTAVADDIGVSKMEVSREPSAWHTPRLNRDVQFLTQSAVDTMKNRLR